jgi:prolyl-tRNA editing enzyme YbaK/EbsC (Cys-tRNA(Pro) deacylase)
MLASAVLTTPSVERVRQALERAGLAARIVELPGAARTARTQTGFAIGGVAPVGHPLSRVFVERKLSDYVELWAAAGHPHTVFRLTYPELVRITGGAQAELAT